VSWESNWTKLALGVLAGVALDLMLAARTSQLALLYLPWLTGVGVMMVETIARFRTVMGTVSTWLYPTLFWATLAASIVLLLGPKDLLS
jgi:hypothetical protein